MKHQKELIIKNNKGSELSFTNYGACLKSWKIKQKDNSLIDVVLGYNNIERYKKNPLYLGSTVGRFANRINKGIFTLNGQKVELRQNDVSNHLHGGFKGFSAKIWEVMEYCSNKVVFSLSSADLDENYPGSLKTIVTYKINDENQLNINFHTKPDEDTILNLTHHSYFNLNGNTAGNILDHELKINADNITEINSELVPTGEFLKVSDTPLDFKKSIKIGNRINSDFYQIRYADGYDHNYIINNYEPNKIRKAATLKSNKTGLKMDVKTDLPGIQFYSGNFLDGNFMGKNNERLKKHSGLCLEPQYFPDSPNHDHFPSTIIKKGKDYSHNIIYCLSF